MRVACDKDNTWGPTLHRRNHVSQAFQEVYVHCHGLKFSSSNSESAPKASCLLWGQCASLPLRLEKERQGVPKSNLARSLVLETAHKLLHGFHPIILGTLQLIEPGPKRRFCLVLTGLQNLQVGGGFLELVNGVLIRSKLVTRKNL